MKTANCKSIQLLAVILLLFGVSRQVHGSTYSTATVVSSKANPATMGSPDTITATVNYVNNGVVTLVPTGGGGTVQFSTVDGTLLGDAVTWNGTGVDLPISSLGGAGNYSIKAVFSGNSTYNGSTSLTTTEIVCAPIVINVQPANTISASGGTGTFSVGATSAGSTDGLTYQWQVSIDGGNTFNNITGATAAAYTTPPVYATESGNQYGCVIYGLSSSVTSMAATLTVQSTDAQGNKILLAPNAFWDVTSVNPNQPPENADIYILWLISPILALTPPVNDNTYSPIAHGNYQAPFGYYYGQNEYADFPDPINTRWNGYQGGNGVDPVWHIKNTQFYLSSDDLANNIMYSIAIDNAYILYVNGNFVRLDSDLDSVAYPSGTYASWAPQSKIPHQFLKPGNNTIELYIADWGVVNFFAMKIWEVGGTVADGCTVEPSLNGGQFSSGDGTFTFSISGDVNSPWTIFSSTDSKTWTPKDGVTLDGNGTVTYHDPNVNGVGQRFYKVSNGICTSRAFGFEQLNVEPGITAIANQLDASPNNTLDSLFNISPNHTMVDGSQIPSGTAIMKWNSSGGFDISIWDGTSWSPNGAATLNPGEGAFIENNSGSAFTVTFVGLVPETQWTTPSVTYGGWSFVSSMVPQAGGIQSALGYTLNLGDTILQWRNGVNVVEAYYDSNGWWNGPDRSYHIPEPVMNVGESFFIGPQPVSQGISDLKAVCDGIYALNYTYDQWRSLGGTTVYDQNDQLPDGDQDAAVEFTYFISLDETLPGNEGPYRGWDPNGPNNYGFSDPTGSSVAMTEYCYCAQADIGENGVNDNPTLLPTGVCELLIGGNDYLFYKSGSVFYPMTFNPQSSPSAPFSVDFSHPYSW